MKHENIWRSFFAATVVALAGCLASAPAFTAESKPEPETRATPPEALPSPIPLASVPTEQVITHKLLRDLETWAQSDTKVSDIGGLFATEEVRLSKLIEISIQTRFAKVETADLKQSIKRWNTTIEQMDSWLNDLKGTATSLGRDLKRLREKHQVWSISLDDAIEQDVPQEVLHSLQTTLGRVISSEESTQARRDDTLVLQTNISEFRMDLTKRIEMIGAELARRRKSDLAVDHVPLWHAIGDPQIDRSLFNQIFDETQRNWRDVFEYLRERPRRIVAQALLGLTFLFLVWYLGKHGAQKTGEDQEALTVLSIMMKRPLATAILLSTVLTEPLYPKAPESWLKFMAIFLVLALVRLLPGLLTAGLRAVPYLLAGLFILHRISISVPVGNLLNKILLLALTITTTAAMFWGAKTTGRVRAESPSGWLLLLQFASGAGAILGFISIFLSIIGDTGSAYHLTEGILTSVFTAMLLWAAIVLLRTLTVISLNTEGARKLHMVVRDSESICNVCMKLFRWTAIFAWGYNTLEGFGELKSAQASLNRMLHYEFEFGNMSLTPLNFLYFLLAIWLSFQISRILRFIFEKDIIPRTSLPQGVPETISKAVHYGTILVGFFFALSAIGIDGSSLALILGALGFGISFGLQNVVNNFVSGLILLFERPVRVGDRIQVGDMGGIVREIGIRATTVHTWDGAEVIVPNANLISNEIINWTFSDQKRRIEVTVGVAYGVDPETVLALLPSLVTEHPDVLDDPKPIALFLGFGASSLDFSLRCWTKAPAPEIQSDVGVAVNRALVEAGIEIPFPQQDLHVRSVDERVREEFGSKG